VPGSRDASSASEPVAVDGGHRQEPHRGSVGSRLNWLRAGALGANDGIISTAGLVIGVSAATTATAEIAGQRDQRGVERADRDDQDPSPPRRPQAA
jgi:hypothetical protein